MNAKKFIELLKLMREAQIEYFATRDWRVLQKAKALEKKVDCYLNCYEGVLERQLPEQMTFSFDE